MSHRKEEMYPWIIVALYSCLGFTMPAAVTQYSMVVGEVAQALSVPQQTVLLSDTVRAVCLVCSMFFSSWFYRHIGLRKTMALGLTFQILPQFLVPMAIGLKSLPLLFILKGLQGCNAITFPLYISTIVMWVGDRYKGAATAIFNGSFVAGAGIGSWLSGIIIPALGWQSSFYLVGGLCLVFAVPVIMLTRDKTEVQAAPPRRPERKTDWQVVRSPSTWLLIFSLAANTWVVQAVTVDLPVYSSYLGYGYAQTGNMMMAVSIVTVAASALAGIVSDRRAAAGGNPLRSRCSVQGMGYVICIAAALCLPFLAEKGVWFLALAACAMMFGASWAGGVFWALPSEVYSEGKVVEGTAFCSSASNVPNPAAPMVIGVLLGSNGLWTAGWLTCAAVSVVSLAVTLAIPGSSPGRQKPAVTE